MRSHRGIKGAFGPRSRIGGLTLIELLAVMVILVLLAGIVTTSVVKRVEEGRRAKAITDIASLESALEQYHIQAGGYPTTQQGLEALRTKPTSSPVPDQWNGPYITKQIPQDPWGSAYIYVCPGQRNEDGFDIYSLGRDGQEGGEGRDADVTNWE
ncbi:MAG: type II secretion system protein GspG [Armatimonadetes bacterium CG_4_9_14_3_um_filter_58_7]|nr:MAG: type II secretion system protein GspG [Armatimonadetes bacterium CG_4_9_14_3_um_filter_58_7]